MITCGLANATDAIEIMSLSYILPGIRADMPAWAQGAMGSAVFAGMLVGAFCCGWVTDTYGRRPVLIATMLFNSVFTLFFAAASGHYVMIVLRFLTGFGCGGSVPVVFALPAEVVPSSFRGSAITVVAAFWMVGSIVVASLAWAIIPVHGWRPFAVACAMPPLLCAALVYALVHESPRFLLVQRQLSRAAHVMHHAQRLNSGVASAREYFAVLSLASPLQSTAVQLRPLGQLQEEDGDTHGPSTRRTPRDSGTRAAMAKLAALWEPQLWRQTCLLCLVWAGICFGWYGLSNWIPSLLEAKHISMCWSGALSPSCLYETSLVVALFSAPGNLLSYLLVDRLGRSRLMCFSVVVASTAVLLAGISGSTHLTGFLFCVFNAVSVISWNTLDVLSVEVFPTALRGVAMGFLSSVGRVAAMSAQYVFSSVPPDSALFIRSAR